MKILQVTQRFNPSISGSQYHVYRISKGLVNLGHDVTVFTTTSMHNKDIRGFSTSRQFTLKSNSPVLPPFEVIDGIKVYRFDPIFQFWMHMSNPLMFISLLNQISDYDIVHGHVYMGAESDMAAFVCKLKNIPFVFTAHDLITSQNGTIKYIKKIYDIIGRFTLKSASALVALTPTNKMQYENIFPKNSNIKIIPNGVDIEKFENLKSKELVKCSNKTVLFVGRLVKYKGAQYIIEAIPDIIGAIPDIIDKGYHVDNDIKFIFVGEDQGYKQNLIKLAKDLGVYDRCIFTGIVDERELLGYYSIADIFVLPSIGEGFGLVALEAMSSGIPTILANEGGLKYVLSEIGGYPIDMTKNISGQIANHIKKILLDRDINEEIMKQREILKKNYTWEGIVKGLEDLYVDIINEKTNGKMKS